MLFSNLPAGSTVKIHVADNTEETVTINGVTSEANVADAAAGGRDDEVASLAAKINAMGFGTIAAVEVVGDGNDDDSVVITAPKGGLSITDAGANVTVDNRITEITNAVSFNLSAFEKDANLIEAGQSVTYQVVINFALDGDEATKDFVRIHMSDLSSEAIIYQSDDVSGGNNGSIGDLRFNVSELEGVTIIEN